MTDEPKIIVDDDWKNQVEKEKEQLAAEEPAPGQQMPEMPPATFEVLVGTLSSQAMMALGFLPDPISQQVTVNRPMAKYMIDTLGVLEEKTAGNLTEQEANMLRETVHQLRMAFVSISDTSNDADGTEDKPSSIELP